MDTGSDSDDGNNNGGDDTNSNNNSEKNATTPPNPNFTLMSDNYLDKYNEELRTKVGMNSRDELFDTNKYGKRVNREDIRMKYDEVGEIVSAFKEEIHVEESE